MKGGGWNMMRGSIIQMVNGYLLGQKGDVVRTEHRSSKNDLTNRQCRFPPWIFDDQSTISVPACHEFFTDHLTMLTPPFKMIIQQCQLWPLKFNRSFDDSSSSPSFINWSFHNGGSSLSFTDRYFATLCRFQPFTSDHHSVMLVPAPYFFNQPPFYFTFRMLPRKKY